MHAGIQPGRGHWVSLAVKPLVALVSAQVQIPSVGAFKAG